MKKIFSAFVLLILLLANCRELSEKRTTMHKKYKSLTAEEARVILHKGTEAPHTGIYTKHKEVGTYLCKQCGAPLYKSTHKFDSHCGWPSFDDEITGAVKKQLDADGRRTEIVCAHCGGHLGHLFKGEGFTRKNIRHCVNSISLSFEAATMEDTMVTAIFASGCFWGTEYWMKTVEGVMNTEVGYIGGTSSNPTYEQVCSKNTGHAEAVKVTFDPQKTNFKTLAVLFFETHDPTQLNRQGPDIGEQYRSEIFYTTEEQKEIAAELIKELKNKGLDVVTRLTKAGTFWKAEDYHQDYYEKKGSRPYCHFYTRRF